MKCDHPIMVYGGVNNPGQDRVPVPCGKCVPCKKRRVDQWVFRMMQEDKRQEHCHFITLTYDTRSVPISPNGFMTLRRGHETVKRKKPGKDGSMYKTVTLCHFVLFMKRLRKLIPHARLKYYFCGEYGTKRRRPHYHAIVFGCPDVELYSKAWAIDGNNLGDVHVGTVTDDSVAYVMKYIDKSVWRPLHSRDDRIPEYSGMSKHLGDNYLTPEMLEYHKADLSRLYCTKKGGYRVPMPRYYKDKIYSQSEKQLQLDLIQKAVELGEVSERLKFNRLYGTTSLTFEEYKSRQKVARHFNHYNKQKSRDV